MQIQGRSAIVTRGGSGHPNGEVVRLDGAPRMAPR